MVVEEEDEVEEDVVVVEADASEAARAATVSAGLVNGKSRDRIWNSKKRPRGHRELVI